MIGKRASSLMCGRRTSEVGSEPITVCLFVFCLLLHGVTICLPRGRWKSGLHRSVPITSYLQHHLTSRSDIFAFATDLQPQSEPNHFISSQEPIKLLFFRQQDVLYPTLRESTRPLHGGQKLRQQWSCKTWHVHCGSQRLRREALHLDRST